MRLCLGGVDRLGRLSGILLKLRTFRQFLKVYPAYRNKVVLVQLAVSRTTTTHTSPENRITLAKRVGRSEVFSPNFYCSGLRNFPGIGRDCVFMSVDISFGKGDQRQYGSSRILLCG